METWAENLRIIRNNRGLTQLELADKADVARSTIIAYEKGEAQPSMMILQKLAKALNVPYKIFFVESRMALARFLDTLSLNDLLNEFDSFDSRERDLLQAFHKLNEFGQIEAVKRVQELTEILKYTRKEDAGNDDSKGGNT